MPTKAATSASVTVLRLVVHSSPRGRSSKCSSSRTFSVCVVSRLRVYGSPPPAAYHGIMAHFCVDCGTPLEPKQVEGRDLEGCPRCGFVLWHDPKVVTIVVVENDAGEVVVGKRAIHPGYGLW